MGHEISRFHPPNNAHSASWHARLASAGSGPHLASLAAAALVYQFAPSVPLSLLGLAAFAALSSIACREALLLVVFSLPFYPQARDLEGLRFSPTESLILACAAGWGLSQVALLLRSRGVQRFALPDFGGFGWPALLFLAAACLSSAFADQQREALRVLRTVVLEPMLAYLMLLSAGGQRRQARMLVGALVVSALVISAIGFYQWLFTGDIITADDVRRIKVFYGSPNHLGLFLGRVVPFAAALVVFCPNRRVPYALACAALLAAVFLTFSVGAWAGVAASLVLIACLAGRLARVAMVLGVFIGLAATWLLRLERITSHFSLDSGTNLLRLQLWGSAANMLKDHLALGVGPDNFLGKFQKYGVGTEVVWREPTLSHPHNLVLDFWLSTGFGGLVAALWLLGRFFGAAWTMFWARRADLDRAILAGAMASMVDMVVHGLIDNSYFLVDLAVIFWLSLALLSLLKSAPANGDMAEEPA